MRLKIVDRYIIKEIALSWFAVTLVLLIIMITHSLAQILVKVSEGKLGAEVVFPLLSSNVINLLVTLIPLGIYLGVMLAFGRFYKDSEMSAMTACGVGVRDLYRPVLMMGVIAVLITAVLTMWVSPWAVRMEQEIKYEQANRSTLNLLSAGKFIESGDGRHILFTRELSVEQQRLKDVFLHTRNEEGVMVTERSRYAEYQIEEETNDQYLVLVEGQRNEGVPGTNQYRNIEFKRHGVRLPQAKKNNSKTKRSGRSMQALWESNDLADKAELQWRVSLPVAGFLLALLAVPLSHTSPRQGRYAKVGIGILIYIFYANLLVVARKMVAAGQIPEWVGLWWVHLLLVFLIVFMLVYQYGFDWVRSKLSLRGSPA